MMTPHPDCPTAGRRRRPRLPGGIPLTPPVDEEMPEDIGDIEAGFDEFDLDDVLLAAYGGRRPAAPTETG